MISLKQLKYFDAVVRSGHFGRAADQCAVTQPALSMQIQELEKELGVQLLERGRSGIILTEAGREIAGRAARVLTDIRDIVDVARLQSAVLAGPLHLGVIPSLAPYILPALLPLIRDEYPDLDLSLRETQTHHLVDGLLDGGLDLLLLALPVEHADVETMKLFNDRFLLAMQKSRKVANRIRATPEMLQQDRLLLLEEGHCLRDQALAFCNLRRVEHIDTFGASNLSTIVQMVANGLGMTLLPELAIDLECRRGDIKVMRFTDPEPRRVVGLAWRKSSPRKRHFAELG
jgi:LysR family hydrogen peroxide-inducible transcriptional activator